MGSATAAEVSEVAERAPREKKRGCFLADAALRVLLVAVTVASVAVLVTSKQTKLVQATLPVLGTVMVPIDAKFTHSPAFIYLLAAMSVTCLYSIVSALASLLSSCKPAGSAAALLTFAYFDVLALGIVASATGAAGGVAYIGLKGNKHVRWEKICNNYDTFCQHVGGAIALSLAAAVILSILCHLSIFALYSKLRRSSC
uniref:CASP-like protein n=1 Tax=Kalanchoe fedtschenkoi TaxID=63787 RepID=A0A7N0T2H9_KALFE